MLILVYLQVLFAADLKRFQDIQHDTPANLKSSSAKVIIFLLNSDITRC